MILVGQYDSPFVRRIAIALHRYELPFTRNTMSVFGDAEAMRTINPLGRIPSLILDGGEVLIDSWAIHDHLDEIAPSGRRLTPKVGADRRAVLRLTALAAGAVDKAGAIVYERVLRPARKIHQPWIDRCMAQVETALTHLDRAADGSFLAGEKLSQADVMTGCMLAYLRLRLPEAWSRTGYARLARLDDGLQSLPEFVTTAPQPDEAMPAQI